MARINRHEFAEGQGRCSICGTTTMSAANGCTCIWRDVPDARMGKVAPERALRIMAADDIDTIHGRLAELRKEQDDGLNRPDEPIAHMDYGDCCI